MLHSFRNWYLNRRARRALKKKLGRKARLKFEPLEERCVLTSTVYVDFGDAFVGGVLTGTVGALKSTIAVGSNTDVNGPQLYDDFGFAIPDPTTFTLTSYNSVFGAQAAAQRATIMQYVRRFFEPLDLTVVELTAGTQNINGVNVRGAATLDDVSLTLDANEAAVKDNDSYVLVGMISIGPTNYNPALSAYGGIADIDDLLARSNLRDDTSLTLIAGTFQTLEYTANTIAHEAAHNLGLRHTFGNSPTPPVAGINTEIHQSDIMSYTSVGNPPQFGGLNFFSRFPMVIGDGNTSNLVLNATPTPYDQMANDANIGAAPVSYITGTGAYDVITVTRVNATTASVSVQAFTNANFTGAITVPGTAAATTFTYNVSLANPIVIEGGARSDRFVIDASLGQLVTIRGMSGLPGGGNDADELVITGGGALAATYTPGAANLTGIDLRTDWRGTVTIGATTVQFVEFDPTSTVTINNVTTVTVQTPNTDDQLILDTQLVGAVTNQRVRGQTGLATVVPLLFTGVTNLIVDSATADATTGTDAITVNSLISTTLASVTINTGAGSDSVTIPATYTGGLALQNVTFNGGNDDDTLTYGLASFTLPVAGGAVTYNGGGQGAQGDTIVVSNDAAQTTLGLDSVSILGGGAAVLGSVERASLIGGASSNTYIVNGWNGTSVAVDGAGNTDHLQVFGAGAATANYTPGATGANGALTGSITLPTMGIGFSNFETASNVLLQNVTTLTVQTPNAADVLSFSLPVAGQNRILGTTGGINITPLTFTNVLDLIIDSATADTAGGIDAITFGAVLSATSLRSVTTNTGNGNDTVTVNTGFTGTAIRDFVVNGGAGDDTLAVNLANYSLGAGGGTFGFLFNGDGNTANGDTLAVTNDVTTTTLTSTTVASSSGGTINFATLERANLTGGASANSFFVTSWTSAAVNLAGLGGDDGFHIAAGNLDTVGGNIGVDGGAGTADFVVLNDAGHAMIATYLVNTTTVTSSPTGGGTRTFGTVTFNSTLENMTLNATTGANILNVEPSVDTTITVNAGNPTAAGPGDDFLVIDFIGTGGRTLNMAGGNGNWAFPGSGGPPLFGVRKSVFFTGVERTNDQIGFAAAAADPGKAATPLVKYIDVISGEVVDIMAYEASYKFGVQVATVDLDNDGIPEVITAPNKGRAPEIKIFKIAGTTSVLQQTFLAYAANFRNGVNIAAADVDNDGLADIIVTPIRGVVEVKVFKNLGLVGGVVTFATTPMLQFNAFNNRFRGGGTVAAGDLNADGRADIIVGSGTGIAATVVAFNSAALLAAPPAAGTTPAAFKQFTGFFASNFKGGVSVAVGHVNGVNTPDIIVGQGVGGNSMVAILDGASGTAAGGGFNPTVQLAAQFSAYAGSRAAIYVTARDVNGDGIVDFIFTGQASDGRNRGVVRRFAAPFGTGAFTQVPFFGTSIPGGFSVG